MIAADENALTCDFMETYGIIDYRTLPVQKAAILAAGLRADSRIKTLLRDEKADEKTLLLGCTVDALNTLVWFQSEDGVKNTNRPVSVIKALLGVKEEKGNEEILSFDSGEDFEKAKRRILGG